MTNQSINVDFLNDIYRNAQMGLQGTELLIAKTTDSTLKTHLYSYVHQYQQIMNEAQAQIAHYGVTAQPTTPVENAQLWMGVQLGTLIDKTPSHMASMLIQGSTMGIIDGIKAIHEHPFATSGVKQLAHSLVELEQQNVDGMKQYL